MVRVDTNFDSLFQFSIILEKEKKKSCTLEGLSVTVAQPDDPYLCYLDWCD